MKTRQQIEDRIKLFMANIRKGLSYDANVVLLANDIEEAINQGKTLPIDSVSTQSEPFISLIELLKNHKKSEELYRETPECIVKYYFKEINGY